MQTNFFLIFGEFPIHFCWRLEPTEFLQSRPDFHDRQNSDPDQFLPKLGKTWKSHWCSYFLRRSIPKLWSWKVNISQLFRFSNHLSMLFSTIYEIVWLDIVGLDIKVLKRTTWAWIMTKRARKIKSLGQKTREIK